MAEEPFKVVSKGNSLGVQWTWQHHLRNKHFWTMKIPNDCSWVWRCVLKAREQAAKFITYEIADGKETLLWHDPWCSDVPLWHNPAARQQWSSVFPEDSKVEVLINERRWNDVVLQLHDNDLKELICRKPIHIFSEHDQIFWRLTASGEFNTKSAYKALKPRKPKVKWANLVWGKLVIPKHSFTCWQMFSGSLLTTDRLIQKGIPVTNGCMFCRHNRENTLHLFFECPFSKEIWQFVKGCLGIMTDTRSSNWEWWSIIKKCTSKSMEAEILKVFVCAVVGCVWAERNKRKHHNKRTTAAILKAKLVRDIIAYLQVQIEEIHETQEVKVLLDRLGVCPKFKTKNTIACKWQSPSVDTVLINSDGAVSNSRRGFGGLIRNSEGSTLLAYNGGSSSDSVLIHELDAIGFGLKGAEMLNVRKVEVATDSLRAQRILTDQELTPWYCRDKILGILNSSRKFESFSIRHTYRESNQAADYIAGLGSVGHTDTLYFIGPFDEKLNVILENDKSGMLYNRVINEIWSGSA